MDSFGGNRVVLLENKLKKQVIAGQKNGPTANLPPEDRNVIGPAKVQINFLSNILVKTDAYIGGGG